MRRSLGAAAAAGVAAVSLAACGSGAKEVASSNPQTLLHQTFSASHTVKSGVIQVSLVVTPSGSSEISTPLSLTLSGPFQSRGAHQIAESNLTITVRGLGRSGALGIVTAANGAYVRLGGVTYALPESDVAKLQQGLSGSGSGASSPGLATLGIDPEHWLNDPRIVGTETVDGAQTRHLRAGLDVSALLADLNRLLAREASTTAKAGVPSVRISPSTARKLAAAIRDPTVDVWTGTRDAILRRLAVGAEIPVSGTISQRLGGLTSAAVRLSVNYAQINRSQTIATPSGVHSYAELQSKLGALGSALQGSLGGGSTSGSGTTGSGTTGTASSQTSKYASCINSAGGDVTKMQRCAKLLSSGG